MSGSFTIADDALPSPDEYQLIFRLEDEKWDTQIGQDGADASTALLHVGIYSEQNEEYGWNAAVSPQLQPRHLTRIDDTTLTLTLPPFAEYDISQPETLRFVVPPVSVASRQTIIANLSLVIMPTIGFATMNGSLLHHLSEGYLALPAAPPRSHTARRLVGAKRVSSTTLFNTLVNGFECDHSSCDTARHPPL